MDAFDRILLEQHLKIEAFGWAVTAVAPTDDVGAPFAYTVGLTAQGHAELVVAGLDPAISMALLNDLAAHVYHDGLQVAHGQHIGDLIAGYDAVIVEGPATEALWPGTAIARYGPDRVALAQIVWPCGHGLFPWQARYCYPVGAQPLLARP